MPAKSTELHQFVRSMTPAEIRAFKHFCAYQKGNKEYLKLFDVLRKMRHYDEEKVQKALAGTNMLGHLTRTKDYLYDLILRSLATHFKEPGAELNLLTREIAVEVEREHTANAFRLIAKAKRIAHSEEQFEIALSLLRTERKLLLRELERKDFLTALDTNQMELEKVAEKQSNYLVLLDLENNVIKRSRTKFLQNGAQDKSEILALANHPLLKSEDKALSQKALLKFYKVHFEIRKARGETKAALSFLEKKLALYSTSPFLLTYHATDFYNALFLRGLYHQYQGEFEAAKVTLRELKAQAAKNHRHAQFLFERIVMAQLTLGYATKDAEIIHEATQSLENEPERMAAIRIEVRILLFWYRARIAIQQEAFLDAIRWLRPILDLPRMNVRKDLQVSARVLHCVALFETRDWEGLHYWADRYARFIRKNAVDYAYEKVVVDRLRKLPQQSSNLAIQTFLQAFQEELKSAFAEENQQYALHYFDLPQWIAAKIEEGRYL